MNLIKIGEVFLRIDKMTLFDMKTGEVVFENSEKKHKLREPERLEFINWLNNEIAASIRAQAEAQAAQAKKGPRKVS